MRGFKAFVKEEFAMKIITLTLSSAYDVHCYSKKIISGRENFVSLSERYSGGKGINISRALSAFGVENIPIVLLGKENSDEYLKILREDGIKPEVIFIPGRIRENITVHTEDGEETRISFAADGVPEDVLVSVEKIIDGIISQGDILTFTGSIPNGINVADAKAFLGRMKEKGVKIIVDSRSFSLSDLVEIKPYLIKPNKYEAEIYLKREIATEADALSASEELRTMGIENVMLTLGTEGAALAAPEGDYFVAAKKVEAASTIGAGDSSIAGFIYAYVSGLEKSEMLNTAVAFGTAKCILSGTRPPEKKMVEKLIKG